MAKYWSPNQGTYRTVGIFMLSVCCTPNITKQDKELENKNCCGLIDILIKWKDCTVCTTNDQSEIGQ